MNDIKDRSSSFYDRFYVSATESKAHAAFCKRVYGQNLCQHGMADMTQIDLLLSHMKLNKANKFMDIGCGSGLITEYLQMRMNCYATGIDSSPLAVAHAIERTKIKSRKLSFFCIDMAFLPFAPGSYDAITLIDSRYFAEDTESLIENLLLITAPHGKIYLFSDEGRGIAGLDDSALRPEESLIGQLLLKKEIHYQAVNLSRENAKHWKLKERVLRQLRDQFFAEGNQQLFDARMHECLSSNHDLDCRFLFIISKQRGR